RRLRHRAGRFPAGLAADLLRGVPRCVRLPSADDLGVKRRMTSSLNVTQATLDDLDALAPLFDGYRVFYRRASNLPAAREFLRERLALRESVIFIARNERGEALGFTQLYPCFSSVSARRLWILNDLFVAESARGLGGARPDGCSAQVRAANRRDPAGPADRARQRACASAVRVAGVRAQRWHVRIQPGIEVGARSPAEPGPTASGAADRRTHWPAARCARPCRR